MKYKYTLVKPIRTIIHNPLDDVQGSKSSNNMIFEVLIKDWSYWRKTDSFQFLHTGCYNGIIYYGILYEGERGYDLAKEEAELYLNNLVIEDNEKTPYLFWSKQSNSVYKLEII